MLIWCGTDSAWARCVLLCATAAHDREQLDTAIAAFTAVGKELGVI